MRIPIALTAGLVCSLLSAAAADVTFGTVRKGKGKPVPIVWQERGNGVWHVMKDGTLTGSREVHSPEVRKKLAGDARELSRWVTQQAWVYTAEEYGDCDIEFDYWLRHGGNSGIGLWDPTRGEAGIGDAPDFRKTPSKVAYEIQLNNEYPDPQPSGSIYGIEKGKSAGVQKDNEWNRIKVEARAAHLKVFINGTLVAEHDTLPGRPKKGPIGLQLHDQFSVMMIRNFSITIR
jgi:hypothetical protein